MHTKTIQPFPVIGITVRTSNENGQATIDIPKLWGRFFAEGLMAIIPNKVDDTLYCIYTDYEKDHTKPYTTILGCKVHTLETIPAGFIGREIGGGSFQEFTATGNLNEGAVYNQWTKIWATDIPRTYTADFEVYGEDATNPEDAKVKIYIGVKY